ncbi:MAG: hypothetical protein C4335_07600 [Armatimonadota bacterium]
MNVQNTKRRFIVDEWLWHDLGGENGLERQQQAFRFLEQLVQKCDMLVSMKGSAFEQKFYNLCLFRDVRTPQIVRYCRNFVLNNSQKYLAIDQHDCPPLAEDWQIKPDDRYLARLATAGHGIVVTTDAPLMQELRVHQIECIHRDELLDVY